MTKLKRQIEGEIHGIDSLHSSVYTLIDWLIPKGFVPIVLQFA